MAQIDNCRPEIEAALGRPMTARETGEIGRRAGKLKAKLDAAGGDRVASSTIMQNFLDERAAEKSARQAAAASSAAAVVKQGAKWDDMGAFSKQNPAAAAKSMFVSSEKAFKGTKDSIGINMDHASEDVQSGFVAQLGKLGSGMLDWSMNKANDLALRSARAALGKGEDASQFGPQAAKVAGVVKQFQDKQLAQLQAAGVPRGHIEDYMGEQYHDPHKLAKAGDNPYGSDASSRAWVASIMPKLDWARTFGGEFLTAPDADKMARLREVHRQFVAQEHLRWNDASTVIKNRELHFNSPKDAHAYDQQFGNGDSYLNNVQSQLGRTAKTVAMANEWGPNAKATIGKFLDDKSRALVESDASQKTVSDFARAKDKITKQYLPYYLGELNAPQSAAGRWMMELEGGLSTARIGASLPKMFMDVALKANHMARYGSQSAGDFWSGLYRGVKGQVDYMAKRGGDNQEAAREAAAHGSILLRGAGMPVSDSIRSFAGPGVMGKWNMRMLKWGGHNGWTDAMRINAAADEGFDHWTNRDKTFDALPQGKQALFNSFGLGAKEWDVIRKSEPTDFPRAHDAKGFQPSSIADMDKENFKTLAPEGANENQLKYAQNEVLRKYRNLIGEIADRTTVSPSSETRAAIMMGTRPDTALGAALRPFMALKGFLNNYLKSHVYGNVVGLDQDPMNVGWGKAMAAMVKHPGENIGAWGASARLVATMWGMGYLATTVSDLASGKSVENPTGPHWSDAMIRAFGAGALGPMSDMMMTQANAHGRASWQDMLGEYAGPAIETVGDLGASFADAAKHVAKTATGSEDSAHLWKNLGKDASYGAGDIYHSVPMNNLLWTKAATDYMVYDNLMELMNPGYKQRMRQRMMKDRGQTMLLDGSGQ